MRLIIRFFTVVLVATGTLACGRGTSPAAPSSGFVLLNAPSTLGATSATPGEQPPFNLEAILRGDGFGHVTFRQKKDPGASIITLDVWVRDLAPSTSYSLQRAVDTTLDGVCTGTNWLTLGDGPAVHSIVTDDRGTGRADLWRDLSALPAGTAFDIYFRVVATGTTNIALQSDCYRFVVRD